MTLKLTDGEYEKLRAAAARAGRPISEVLRMFWEWSEVFYSELRLSEALVINGRTMPIHRLLDKIGDPPLHEVMRPFPELSRLLALRRALEVEAELRRRELARHATGRGSRGSASP